MSEYTDKLQEWVDSVKMCEAAGIAPCYKYRNEIIEEAPLLYEVKSYPQKFTFPIAAAEGKPVFVGDELYYSWRNENSSKVIAVDMKGFNYDWSKLSWNPPKQKTVMVEILVEDADFLRHPAYPTLPQLRISEACRKALEEMK